MIVGPVFSREVATSPRRVKLYVTRSAFAGALLVLMSTAWLLITGTQVVSSLGAMAVFGSRWFQFLAPLQLVLVLAFSALLASNSVAQEKDRRTLHLLLMTRLSNSELVLGKLFASWLIVMVMLGSALPVFMLSSLFGGVSIQQIARVFAVSLAAALLAGSLGSTLAYWREKTFQALAMTALVIVLWLGLWEAVRVSELTLANVEGATIAAWFSPWQAMLSAAAPSSDVDVGGAWYRSPVSIFLLVAGLLAGGLNAVAIWRVRTWQIDAVVRHDPNAEQAESILEKPKPVEAAEGQVAEEEKQKTGDLLKHRQVWDNPILWRELMTWAFGRKVLAIRFIYCVLALCTAWVLFHWNAREVGLTWTEAAGVLVPLGVLSLVLVNAQAVTSFCTERDGKTLDLLLVTDLLPRELIFGKLGGIFYNAKEMVLLPMLICLGLMYARDSSGRPLAGLEEAVYLMGGLLVMDIFVAMLGLHAGMTYHNSRNAIGVSLGTVFFLFLGIGVCMRMMVAFAGSFEFQLLPFVAFLLGGGVGLYAALGIRNPSPAIGWASFLSPFATFWAITSLLQGFTLSVFLVLSLTYGFATAAMLVPALDKFDVALGRTTGDE